MISHFSQHMSTCWSGKKGAVLRILYSGNIEKREIRENGRNNSLLRVQHYRAYIICLDCIGN